MRQLEERVEEVDDPFADLKAGSMISVLLSNCKVYPVIGQVQQVTEEQVEILYFKGSYLKSWTPHMIKVKGSKKSEPWKDWLPKKLIILSNFESANGKLTQGQRKFLRSKYAELG